MTEGPARLLKAARFAASLPRFASTPVDPVRAAGAIPRRLERRQRSFLDLVRRAVYAGPADSPYRRLLEHAGVEPGDLERLVAADGLEGALARLRAEGVRLSLDEFRGLEPIRRGSLELHPRARDFDNPLLRSGYASRTGGTRSSGIRLTVDLALLEFDAPYDAAFLLGFGLLERPYALWRPAPPGRAGLNNALRRVKLGLRAERWFSQYRPTWRSDGLAALGWHARPLGRLVRVPLPAPEHVPPERAEVVGCWLASSRGILDAPASSGVRACRAAAEAGLDLDGAFVRVGGEPFTRAKAAAIAASGARAAAHYAMAEVGRAGIACVDPSGPDDVHLLSDKLCLLRPAAGHSAPISLELTTLAPVCPKLMLNVEVGDEALVDDEPCGCSIARLGLGTRLRGVRSREKLTSEGMNFYDADLLALVEEVLPGRFGGAPGDYQLLEHERDGVTRIEIAVAPGARVASDEALVEAVLGYLAGRGQAGRMMAEGWRRAGTLSVTRTPPRATATGKMLPLHLVL